MYTLDIICTRVQIIDFFLPVIFVDGVYYRVDYR